MLLQLCRTLAVATVASSKNLCENAAQCFLERLLLPLACHLLFCVFQTGHSYNFCFLKKQAERTSEGNERAMEQSKKYTVNGCLYVHKSQYAITTGRNQIYLLQRDEASFQELLRSKEIDEKQYPVELVLKVAEARGAGRREVEALEYLGRSEHIVTMYHHVQIVCCRPTNHAQHKQTLIDKRSWTNRTTAC